MPFTTPKIRKLFTPDPDHIVIDVDLAGADAQVVAWEAEDEDLKAAFRAGVKIHDKNATDVFGDAYTKLAGDRKDGSSPKGRLYDGSKRATHGTNYLGSAKTLHLTPDIGWPMDRCEWFQRTWFGLHPGIPLWHKRTEVQLRTNRTITNKFGFSITYFDRLDACLTKAIAWTPQSTIAILARKSGLELRKNVLFVRRLLQVHDSWVLQFHRRHLEKENLMRLRAAESGELKEQLTFIPDYTLELIRKTLTLPVPYDDPLVIQWGLSISTKSWGDCIEVPWPNV